jgi:poly(A) polymerase
MALELTGSSTRIYRSRGGLDDLVKKVLRTPVTAQQSFSDDPLRMMRAARFSQVNLISTLHPDVSEALAAMAGRISIISAERIREEFIKLLLSPSPRIGITILVESGLCRPHSS